MPELPEVQTVVSQLALLIKGRVVRRVEVYDPKLALDAQGVVGMAATLGMAGATGGLSLLAQQLLKAAPEEDVCRTALDGPGTAPAAVPASPSPPQPSQRSPQALPDALRKIFK